jgi:hypothetical protein
MMREPNSAVEAGESTDEALLFLRVGERDAKAAQSVVAISAKPPAGITTAITDRGLADARRAAKAAPNVAFGVDPVLWRLELAEYWKTARLDRLSYAPESGEPWRPSDFDDVNRRDAIADAVVREQADRGATFMFAAHRPPVSTRRTPVFPDNELLRASMAARDLHADGTRLFLPVVGTLAGLRQVVSTSFAWPDGTRPDAIWLMVDELSEKASPVGVRDALKIVQILQAAGAPVIVARAGGLRGLFHACGVAGSEIGLGRLIGFRLGDYRRRRGPGFSPPRFEMPSLHSSLPQSVARALLSAEAVPESTCPCPACEQGRADVEDRLARASEHNAWVACNEQRTKRRAPRRELTKFADSVRVARRLEFDLRAAGLLANDLTSLRLLASSIEAIDRDGFLDDQDDAGRAGVG